MLGLKDINTETPLYEDKMISVIIPCYNSERYLENCFSCLDNSTYENLQIIFVDDGSTDKTGEVIEKYVSEKKNAEYYYVNHCGVAEARNKGLSLIKGEYVTFYDVDDTAMPDHFENLKNVLETTGADVAVCAYTRDKTKKNKKLKKNELRVFYGEEAIERLLSQSVFNYCLWNKMFRADIIKNNDVRFPENENYGEDSYFNYFYFKHAKKVAYTSFATYRYEKNKGSLVLGEFTERRLDIFNGLNVVIKDAKKGGGKILDSAHAARSLFVCETLYFINKYKYKNKAVTDKLVLYLKEDVKHLRKCKYVSFYRRLLIPLVPLVSVLFFGKVGKNIGGKTYELPPNFRD